MIFQFFVQLLDHTHFHNRIHVPWRQEPGESDLFSYPQGWAPWVIHRNFWIHLCWLRKEDPSPTLSTLADRRSTLVSSLQETQILLHLKHSTPTSQTGEEISHSRLRVHQIQRGWAPWTRLDCGLPWFLKYRSYVRSCGWKSHFHFM